MLLLLSFDPLHPILKVLHLRVEVEYGLVAVGCSKDTVEEKVVLQSSGYCFSDDELFDLFVILQRMVSLLRSSLRTKASLLSCTRILFLRVLRRKGESLSVLMLTMRLQKMAAESYLRLISQIAFILRFRYTGMK